MATVIDGLAPGEPVGFTIWTATYGPWAPCGAGATPGTLTVAGAG